MTLRSSVGGIDCFLVKFDTDGSFQWVRTWGGVGSDSVNTVCVNAMGFVYSGGMFEDSNVDFDPDGTGDLHSSNGSYDSFITCLHINRPRRAP